MATQFNVGSLFGRLAKPAAQQEHGDQTLPQAGYRVLFVCTGNIARSASAQYLAQQLSPVDSRWSFDSAGTGAVVGSGVAPHIDAELDQRGVDYRGHRAKQVRQELLDYASLVLVMEKGHLDWLVNEWPQYRSKIHLLGQMARVRQSAGRRADPVAFMTQLDEPPRPEDAIADPYRKGPEAAEKAVAEVELALTSVLPWLGV